MNMYFLTEIQNFHTLVLQKRVAKLHPEVTESQCSHFHQYGVGHVIKHVIIFEEPD